MDIAAFHANGISPTDIRDRVVADHQHFGSREPGLRERRIEESGCRLFGAEVGGEENPVKNSVQQPKPP